MIEVIGALAAFFMGQWIAYRSKWVTNGSLLKMIASSIGVIGFSMILFVFAGKHMVSIVVVPTVICAAILSAKYRMYITGFMKQLKGDFKNGA
ncbi:hypothetical protein EV207_11689 [Scopulibacillus darangshiensis]|uniref:Uncharacterized protein n=1 Tax=Scopulibacillus darangshiensis TaxID=442528 RepID=A0A4R2P2I7_9BACL|nr:hypothetical protein [Scopulibacillus darangshiensis]TCP28777.1 hypothetical protein EV207_11689 [Scopulibacillus darangshiensis]